MKQLLVRLAVLVSDDEKYCNPKCQFFEGRTHGSGSKAYCTAYKDAEGFDLELRTESGVDILSKFPRLKNCRREV